MTYCYDSENSSPIIDCHFVEISWHKALEVLALPHDCTFKALLWKDEQWVGFFIAVI